MVTAARLPPQCVTCKHWDSPLEDPARADLEEPIQICAAFPLPLGIPAAIWANEFDHRRPYPGDHNVQWTSDSPFPDWAMNVKG